MRRPSKLTTEHEREVHDIMALAETIEHRTRLILTFTKPEHREWVITGLRMMAGMSEQNNRKVRLASLDQRYKR